ncbi:rhodanese-like domain-containing protein [Leeuwenhoekiella marinoflava]|uniref:Rhodanese-related sulfurtransferase n=2 Tax=Leeuwenhoekiella marinoflava TaxID=988 RepID=A0A4Q0PMA6_9FLAO|nr:rhodanese-like domain-containing protein [Leeuwenhoekiella marinoflava]RXG30828.1 rhodanese-related sulfurtransferase [Leeuwenhoekiella marinoflava]SHF15150.1 Rhodanese-related sulfurtransferase [Leeuwenhoekiella marinoflava DSM 3653]
MKLVLSLIFISLFSFQTQAQGLKYQILDKVSFADSLKSKQVLLIDVRRPEEFEAGKIENAQNINVLEPENFNIEIEKLDKSKPIYIYCRSGNRSGKAAQIMQDAGFTKIFDLEGGYLNWTADEQPED